MPETFSTFYTGVNRDKIFYGKSGNYNIKEANFAAGIRYGFNRLSPTWDLNPRNSGQQYVILTTRLPGHPFV